MTALESPEGMTNEPFNIKQLNYFRFKAYNSPLLGDMQHTEVN
jgi:hypothetical protein